MTKADFPKSFIFGTATAAYQVEGAAREDGRGESIWDRFSHTPGKTRNGETGDVACDHYHRVDEDLRLIKDLGVGAYRFSIAWPRIIPDGEGAVNQRGLDWYSRLVDKLLAAGITPFATMYHWDLPQALEDRYGGWRSRKTAEAFGVYAAAVVKHLGDRVRNWIPVNEMPAVIVAGYGAAFHAPGVRESRRVLNQIQHQVLLAHGLGVRAVREHGRRASRVGTAHNVRVFVPAYETPEHIEAAGKAFQHYNGPMLESMTAGRYPAKWLARLGADAPKIEPGDMELICSPCDFIGLNVYRGTFVRSARSAAEARGAAFAGVENVGLPAATTTPSLAIEPTAADGFVEIPFPPSYPVACAGWIAIVPESIYWGVRHLCQLYGYKKVYVTENGCAMDDRLADGEILDSDRMMYFREYLRAAARAVAERLPLKGYFAWSLMDNFEWAYGYSHRFGLYYTDFQTQQRTAKLNARYYAACIAARRVL